MDAPDRPWRNLCPRPRHVGQANRWIRPAAKESRFVRPKGDQLCPTSDRGTCPVPVQSREHLGYRLGPPPGRGRLARKLATLPRRDHVQSLRVRGVLLARSIRRLSRWDFAVRDSTCRRFPTLFLSKRTLDSTRRLAARVSMLQCDAPAHSTARRWRCQRLLPAIPDRRRCRKNRRTVQLAEFPFAASILGGDLVLRHNPDERHRDSAIRQKQACRSAALR